MAGYSGPEIANSGLVLHLDAANYKNFSLTSVEVLVVAGGGGGGGSNLTYGGGGGGGGGGIVYSPSVSISPGTSYTVIVGAGGAGGNTADSTRLGAGYNGSDSQFASLVAVGGGGGGNGGSTAGVRSGYSGGSGGGAGYNLYSYQAGSAGTASQGYAGGNVLSNNNGAGGGGAGGAGGNTANGGTTNGYSAGGQGITYAISGSPVVYATGGAGTNPSVSTSVVANSGNGGNGVYAGSPGGAGSSGIVIVRYHGPQRAIGGTVTTSGKYTIHTFTSVGSTTFTPMTTSTLTGLADLSGNNNFGTPVNGPTYNGANGGSIVFDGVDDYISYQHLSSLDIRREITLEVWFKLTSLSFATSWSNILSKMNTNGDGSTRTYSAFINSSGYVHLCSADVIGQEYLNSTSFISSNNWYHWIGVINRSVGSIQHFVNGKLDQSGTIRTTDTISHTEPVCLNIRGGYSRFSGYISSAKIYNRALSAAEILQSFEATRSRFGI